MSILIHQPGLGNELPRPSITDRLRARKNDPRTHEQRAEDREARREERRRRAGMPPRAEVQPMTYEEHDAFCKRIADREAVLVFQVRGYVDWLISTPGPLTDEVAAWLEYAASESLISDKQLASLRAWARRIKPKTSATDEWIASVMAARRAG